MGPTRKLRSPLLTHSLQLARWQRHLCAQWLVCAHYSIFTTCGQSRPHLVLNLSRNFIEYSPDDVLVYESLQSACQLLSPDCFMAKIDLVDGQFALKSPSNSTNICGPPVVMAAIYFQFIFVYVTDKEAKVHIVNKFFTASSSQQRHLCAQWLVCAYCSIFS